MSSVGLREILDPTPPHLKFWKAVITNTVRVGTCVGEVGGRGSNARPGKRTTPRVTNSKFFGVQYRFRHLESRVWAERLYGLASLCVDLGLVDRNRLAQLGRMGRQLGQGASGSAGAPVSGASAKSAAYKLKKEARSPVWHAYRMYADPASLAKECVL